MIGAIVAEFFGTPIVGMGFRISTEVGRMNVDMVWAEIAEQLVSQDIDAVDGLVDAIREQIAEKLSASMNDDGDETDERR